MPPSNEAKQELFAFYRELEQNLKLKELYFRANNRSDRKKIIESLGFDAGLVQEAVNSIPIEVNGETFTLAEWLTAKSIDPESLAPVRAVLNALNRVEQSGALDQIIRGYDSYKASLDRSAGGASKDAKLPERVSEGAKGVETEVEASAESDAISESSSEISDVRHGYEQVENESEADVSEQENGISDSSREDIGSEISDLKDGTTGDISDALNPELSTIEENIQADGINEIYNLLVNEGASLQNELDSAGTNAQVTVTETYDAAGAADGAEIQVSDSNSIDKTEGNAQITGEFEASATLDVDTGSEPSLSNVDITGTAGISGSTSIDESNKDGSISGEASFNDQGTVNIDLNPSESSNPTVTTSTTGLDVNLEGKVNESIREDFNEGPIDIDGTTTIAGNIDESINVDLRNPSESTATNDGNSVEIWQDESVSGSKSIDESNKDGTISGEVSFVDQGAVNIDYDPSESSSPTITAGTSGLDINLEGKVDESINEDFNEGPIDIDGTTTLTGNLDESIDVDLRDPSESKATDDGNSIELQQDVAVSGSTDIDESNKYGSVSGEISFSDQGSVGIGLDPSESSSPVITTSTTGLDINLEGKVDESINEDFNEGPIDIDGTTTLTGNLDESIDVDLRDPSESKATNDGDSIELEQDVTAKGTLDTNVDGVEISATLGASVQGDVEISEKGVTTNASLEDIDIDLKADDTKPIELGTYDTGVDIVTVFANPSASVDLSIDPNTGKVDVTGKSLDPNITAEVEPS